MKIGFDVSQTGQNKAGCGHFADSLIRAMAALDKEHEWLLYSNFGEDFWDPDHNRSTTRLAEAEHRFSDFDRQQAQAFWANPGPDFEERLGRPEILHANNFYCPPQLPGSRLVYTLYDLAVFSHPDLTTEANRLVCTRGIFRASLQADLIVAISSYTRDHFLQLFPHFPSDRIAVVHPASRFSQENGAEKPIKRLAPDSFWLGAGTLEPRKNWRFLLEAYAALRSDGRTDRKLVLAGGRGWMEDDLPEFIRRLGIEGEVIFTGYVSDEQLRWLYNHCFAFVYPSLFEGFGMPVLEAMNLGAAVITSDASSLPEVAGEAALLIDPGKLDTLTAAMTRLEQDPELVHSCRRLALQQAGRFSWRESARKMLGLYASLAQER